MPNYCTIAKIFLKISRAINTLGQTGPILLQKEIFLGKLTNVTFVLYFCMYCVPSCHKISKKFPEGNYFGLSIESHHTTTFQNSQRAYNQTQLLAREGCIVLAQIEPKLPNCTESGFLWKLTNITFVYLLCPIMLKCFKKYLYDKS